MFGGEWPCRAAAGLCAFVAAPAMGQSLPQPAVPPQLPSQSDISRARIGLPPPEAPSVDLSIQTPERSAIPKSVDTIDFHLTRIVVDGATAFPQAIVDGYFAGLTGRAVQLNEVREAAAKLEDRYHERGYFLTRVFVPPQRIADGQLTVRVIEGYIDAIEVTGIGPHARAQAQAILAPLKGRKPIDLAAVERRLLILNDLPGMNAASVLRPGSALGASTLLVTITPPRTVVQASVSNTNSRLLGPWVYSVAGNLARPLGLPGALTLSASASGPGLGATQSGSWRYSLGLGASGIIASVGQIVARAHPGGSLLPLDVRTDLLSTSVRLRYPLIRTRRQSLFIEGGLSINQSSTDILQQEIVDDHDTVIDAALTYQQTGWLGGSTSVVVDLYHGLPILGALNRGAGAPSVAGFDPTFTRVTYSVQRLQALPRRFSVLAALQGQYSDDKLLTGELVAFGGPAIGRAYDPSTITGDRGIGGIGELRYDWPVNRPWLSTVQFYGFADAASTTALVSSTFGAVGASVRSVGGGVRLAQRRVAIDVQAAKQFRTYRGTDQRSDPRVLLTASATF